MMLCERVDYWLSAAQISSSLGEVVGERFEAHRRTTGVDIRLVTDVTRLGVGGRAADLRAVDLRWATVHGDAIDEVRHLRGIGLAGVDGGGEQLERSIRAWEPTSKSAC